MTAAVTEGPHLVATTRVDDAGEPSLASLLTAIEDATTALERIAAVRALTKALEVIERESVNEAKATGSSWTAIAEQLGVTKQAAARRFAPPPATAEKATRAKAGKSVTQQLSKATRERPARAPYTRAALATLTRPRRWRARPGLFWVAVFLIGAIGIPIGIRILLL